MCDCIYMTYTAQARSYHRIGTMTYEVRTDGAPVGTVWRTRRGWSAKTTSGEMVTEDYPGSRDTAAGLLVHRHNDTQGA